MQREGFPKKGRNHCVIALALLERKNAGFGEMGGNHRVYISPHEKYSGNALCPCNWLFQCLEKDVFQESREDATNMTKLVGVLKLKVTFTTHS